MEEGKYVQASAFVQSSIFQEYHFREDTAVFQIHLTVLLDCLHIFGASSAKDGGSHHTALKMSYDGHGSPLKLLLAEVQKYLVFFLSMGSLNFNNQFIPLTDEGP